jgi:hypothetical protein
MHASAGDWLVVTPPRLGEPPRRGLILGVRGAGGEPPYRVRWTDTDHETLVFPGPDFHVEHHAAPGPGRGPR